MKGFVSEEALAEYARLVTESLSTNFAEGETYDFARCMRSDGSFYGTSGTCKKGTKAGDKEEPEGFKPGQFPRKGKEDFKNQIIDMKYKIAKAKENVDSATSFSSRKKAKAELENLERRRLKLLKEYKGWEH